VASRTVIFVSVSPRHRLESLQLAVGQCPDGLEPAAVLVATRVMLQQAAERKNPQLGQ